MTRRSTKGTSEQPGVSLFPFLAVLLCTMGMLVMLLVAIGQGTSSDRAIKDNDLPPVALETPGESAQAVASRAKTESVPEELKQQYEAAKKKFRDSSLETVKAEVENSEWFLEELRGINARTATSLKTERDRLASLETAMTTRFRELKQLRESVKLLQDNDSTRTSGEKDLDKTIAEAVQKIESLKKEIETLRKNLAESKNSYAVVPYRGKSGTQRRPIYIECTQDAIRLMPEGIEFSIEDFLLARSPANPFDTAVRTARSCFMEKYGDAAGEPYPLLIVRPGGADKYYAALAALSSWGGDYGYEFVDDDWKLEYPPADEEIASRIRDQVAFARYKLAVPLAAMLAESPGLVANGFSGGNGSSEFKSGVSATQDSSGHPFGQNVKLSANAGMYRRNSDRSANVPGASGRTGLIPAGNGTVASSRLGDRSGMDVKQPAHAGNGTNALHGIDPGNYREATLAPGYSANPIARQQISANDTLGSMLYPGSASTIAQGSHTGNLLPAGTDQALPAYEGKFRSNTLPEGNRNTLSESTPTGMGIGQQPLGTNGNPVTGPTGQNRLAPGGASSNEGLVNSNSPASIGQHSEVLPSGHATAMTSGTVPGEQTSGRPTSDPAARIVSQIEGRTELPATQHNTPALESGWETVGNTAIQRQTGHTSGAPEGTCPVGSACSNAPSTSVIGSDEGGAMPQMTFEKRKDLANKQNKEKKNPHELDTYDPYKNLGFNLTQKNRQPVNSMIERPIRVECYRDRIVFPKQSGIRNEQTVMLNQDRDKINEQLLRQVALCVKTWGVAGRNMYWTPWIRAQSATDAGQSTIILQEFFTPQGIAVRPDGQVPVR